jgi:hypothetical protein
VEVHPVRAELGELADRVRRVERRAHRVAERVAAHVAHGPQAEGEAVLGARRVGVVRCGGGHGVGGRWGRDVTAAVATGGMAERRLGGAAGPAGVSAPRAGARPRGRRPVRQRRVRRCAVRRAVLGRGAAGRVRSHAADRHLERGRRAGGARRLERRERGRAQVLERDAAAEVVVERRGRRLGGEERHRRPAQAADRGPRVLRELVVRVAPQPPPLLERAPVVADLPRPAGVVGRAARGGREGERDGQGGGETHRRRGGGGHDARKLRPARRAARARRASRPRGPRRIVPRPPPAAHAPPPPQEPRPLHRPAPPAR